MPRPVPSPPAGLMPVLETAPIITCRAWQEGDERRGLRAFPCCVPGCRNTLAVSPQSCLTADTYGRAQLMCERDSTARGANPNGRQMHADIYGEPPPVAPGASRSRTPAGVILPG